MIKIIIRFENKIILNNTGINKQLYNILLLRIYFFMERNFEVNCKLNHNLF
jgi:hypothetical protein